MSSPISKWAPVSRTWSTFSSTMAVEMRGIFTANVPPKPQQSSGRASGTYSRPSTICIRRTGCATTSSSRRVWQEWWKVAVTRRATGSSSTPRTSTRNSENSNVRAASATAAASSGRPANSCGNPSRTMAAHDPEMETTCSLAANARRNARAVARAASAKPAL